MTPGQAPTTQAFSLSSLDVFKSGGGFPSDYPANVRRFYSPYDQVHAAFKALVASATESLLCSMYGFDDPELAVIILSKAQDPAIFVQINLDSSQAAGQAEVPLVKELQACPSTRVAIGQSEDKRINHLKMTVVDGLYTLSGSTNWSADGEAKQNNECSIHMDRVIAHEATTILNKEHQVMLTQMAAKEPSPYQPAAVHGSNIS